MPLISPRRADEEKVELIKELGFSKNKEEVNKRKERIKKNIKKVKAITNMFKFYYMVRKIARENKSYIAHVSLKKFVYYYERERMEEKIKNWIFYAIKIPFKSILKTSKLDFDISNHSRHSEIKIVTSVQNEQYIKLEVL